MNPVYTKTSDCQDCYKCIRGCEVKAIGYENRAANILDERCVACGDCVKSCPIGAQRIGTQKPSLLELLHRGAVLIVDPASEFQPYIQLEKKLRQAGFSAIYDLSLGVELFLKQLLAQPTEQLQISSFCPSLIARINKHQPHLNRFLTPVSPPVLQLSRLIKEQHPGVATVYLGSCLANKLLSGSELDLALTFREFRMLLPQLPMVEEESPLYRGESGGLALLNGGLGELLRASQPQREVVSAYGSKTLTPLLKSLEADSEPLFLDLGSCENGCLSCVGSQASKKLLPQIHYLRQNYRAQKLQKAEIMEDRKQIYFKSLSQPQFLEREISAALATIGFGKKSEEKNCSACGYQDCRSFAQALLLGQAMPSMCLTFLRKMHNRTQLLKKELEDNLFFHQQLIDAIPLPIFYRDSEGRYLGCNRANELFSARPKEQIVGHLLEEVLPPEEQQITRKMDRALLLNQTEQIYEHTRRDAAGEEQQLVYHKAVFRNLEQKVGGIVGVITDISKLRRVQNELQVAKEASELALALLRKMPSGYLLVNEQLEIIECNESFAKIVGAEAEALFEVIPGLTGADLASLVPFADLFKTVLQKEIGILERDLVYDNKMLRLSLFSIEQHKAVGALLLDMSAPEVRKEQVINRAQAIIKENMETVQKIAYLLGENAAKTEEMLSSIMQFYQNEGGK